MVALTSSPINESNVEPSPYAWLRSRAPIPTSYAPACAPMYAFREVLKNRTSRARRMTDNCAEVPGRKCLICIEIWQVELEICVWRVSFHKYAYVHGDPIQGIDPTGLFTMANVMAGIGIGVTVGAIGGGIFGFIGGVLQAGDEPDLWSAFGTIVHYTVTGVVLCGLGGGVAGFAFVGSLPALIVGGSGLAAAGLLKFSDVTLDELFAALPYLPFMGTPNSWIRQLSPKIIAEAKKHDVPEELIASVLLYELNQINVMDTVFDREVFSGNYRSIGVAQLRYDNVRNWVPSQSDSTDREIRAGLIDPTRSVAFLAEAMAFWSNTKGSESTGTKVSRSTWDGYSQAKKEYVTKIFASAKDFEWGATHGAAEIYGVRHGLHVIQSPNSPLKR